MLTEAHPMYDLHKTFPKVSKVIFQLTYTQKPKVIQIDLGRV